MKTIIFPTQFLPAAGRAAEQSLHQDGDSLGSTLGTLSEKSANHEGAKDLLSSGVLYPTGSAETASRDTPSIGLEDEFSGNHGLQRTPGTSRRATRGDILLADDEPLVRKFIATVLMSEGYRVLQARNSLEAILYWREHKHFDLIVSDVNMPDISGPDFVETIWTQGFIPVLYMSGLPPDDTVSQHVLDGRAQFIAKPFGALALRRKVQAILRVSRNIQVIESLITESAARDEPQYDVALK